MTLAINITDGCGFSNEVCCGFLPMMSNTGKDNSMYTHTHKSEGKYRHIRDILSHKPTTVAVYMTRLVAFHVSWHFTSCGIPCLMILHASCKSRFTWEIFEFYTRMFACNHAWIVMRGLSCVCEIIVEVYRTYKNLKKNNMCVKVDSDIVLM